MTIRRLKFQTQRSVRRFWKKYSKGISGISFVLLILLATYLLAPKKDYITVDQCPEKVTIQTIATAIEPTIDMFQPEDIPSPVSYDIVENAKVVVANRYADSPFLENNRLQTAYELLGRDDNKFKIFMAIAGNESAFGQSNLGKNCNNYWGYLYPSNKGAGCGSPRWDTPDHSIARFIELEGGGWLAKFDGTKQSLDLYDSNHGNYCGARDNCEAWKSHIWSFVTQFSNY